MQLINGQNGGSTTLNSYAFGAMSAYYPPPLASKFPGGSAINNLFLLSPHVKSYMVKNALNWDVKNNLFTLFVGSNDFWLGLAGQQ